MSALLDAKLINDGVSAVTAAGTEIGAFHTDGERVWISCTVDPTCQFEVNVEYTITEVLFARAKNIQEHAEQVHGITC